MTAHQQYYAAVRWCRRYAC